MHRTTSRFRPVTAGGGPASQTPVARRPTTSPSPARNSPSTATATPFRVAASSSLPRQTAELRRRSRKTMVDSRMHFTFSDTIAGSVVAFQADEDAFTLKTIDGREFEVKLTSQTFAEVTRNLGEAYIDATSQMRDMLDRGRMLFAYGIFYPENGGVTFEAKH